MKKLYLLALFLTYNTICSAQLKVALSHEEQQEKNRLREQAIQDSLYQAKQTTSYDSLVPYPKHEAIYGLVGQRLMVKPYNGTGPKKSNYVKFFTSPSIVQVYKPTYKYEYKHDYDYFFEKEFTNYSAVSGRIFTVLKVLDYDDTERQKLLAMRENYNRKSSAAYDALQSAESVVFRDEFNHEISNEIKRQHIDTKDSLEKEYYRYLTMERELNAPELHSKDTKAFLMLVDEKDTIYYMFDKLSDYPDFPFNIEGYITKLTELRKNERYAKCISMDDYTDTDFYTGKTIRFYVGQIWWLKEIVIDPEYGDLVELYTNSKGEVYKAPHFTFSVAFKTKKESDRIKKKYGEATWKAIMTYTIYKGMSKSAVKESWGEPKYINDASYGEQWVYDDKYVYFRNGRVTGWN